MHAKAKGTIGELVVTQKLVSEGFHVFSEVGDLSRVDLIALIENVPIKIQVKAVSQSDGKIEIYTRKTGPNYSFRYSENDVDIFAVYVLGTDTVFYVSAKEHLSNKSSSVFRLSKTKNGQQKNVRLVEDYLNIKNALRDYTPNTLPNNVEGDDIVQTTTEKSG